MKRVLEDIRVLDFGRFIAGPYCGMLLADMGAEVIRIDRPGGEEDRTAGLTGPNGENLSFPNYARSKKGITLDVFDKDQGQKILTDLVKRSDVVLHSYSPEAARRAGLIYEDLVKINQGSSSLPSRVSEAPARIRTEPASILSPRPCPAP